MIRWAHQTDGVEAVMDAIAAGCTRICLTSPTGMGKTVMVADLVRRFLDVGKKALLYTARKLMVQQLADDMNEHGIMFGIRAAGHYPERHQAFQIASLPTDKVRSKSDDYADHEADIVIVDEGHLHVTGAGDKRIIGRHLDRGAVVVYVTATPIGMAAACEVLIVAGRNSDGRRCGALVLARHFGPDEPAITKFQHRSIAGLLNFSDEDNRKTIMRPGIFGRVLQWYDKLNKKRKPTILFAPGVPESRWFAQEFFKHGISAAHISGEDVWINGEELPSTPESRDEVRDGSRNGTIQIVCNRFVLREGANWPWLAHGIFATIFDSLQSYLQAGGRLLRSHPLLKTVCIQDHGGNWWRHGSLNEDRLWDLEYNARVLAGAREEGYRDKNAPPEAREPLTCPKCMMVLRGPMCPECGFAFPERERFRNVVQENGTLVRINGKMFRPKAVHLAPDTVDLWRKVYWSMKAAKRDKSFAQAIAWFHRKHRYRPPRNLPLMPKSPYDWYRKIKMVSFDRLIPDPKYTPGARPSTKTPAKQEKGLFDEPPVEASQVPGSEGQ